MRHLAVSLALLALLGASCGPRAGGAGEFPSPPAASGTPEASPASASAPSSGAASPAASASAAAAEGALRDLWTLPPKDFYNRDLLESRRKDTSLADFEAVIVGNVVGPMGPLREVQPISQALFDLAEGYLTVGIYPGDDSSQAEQDRYGPALQTTWWSVGTEKGEVLAAVVMAPGPEGKAQVQTMVLRCENLGAAIEKEDPKTRQAVERILDLVEQGKGGALFDGSATPGLKERLPRARFEQSVAEFRHDLPAAPRTLRMEQGRRWYSSEGWTQTFDYEVSGGGRTLKLNVNLLEEGLGLQGLSWATGEVSPTPGAASTPGAGGGGL